MKHLNIIILSIVVFLLVDVKSIYSQNTDLFSPFNRVLISIKNPDNSIVAEKQKLNDTGIIHNDTNKIVHQLALIQAYQLKEHADSAWLILKQCKKLLESNPRKFCSDYDYWWIAKTYYAIQQKDRVQWWLDSALARLKNSPALGIKEAYAATLSSLFKQNNNFNAALKYQALSDSLALVMLQEDFKARQDSVAAVIAGLKDSLSAKAKKLNEKQEEFDKKANYWLIAFALIILLQIFFVFYFFLKGRKKATPVESKKVVAINTTSFAPQVVSDKKLRSDVTNIYGLTGLMLDKARSGEDLTFLKSIQNIALELFNKLRPEASHINEELDSDKIIRKLKGIRVLIVSADNASSLMLKEYLRKKIRLCTVNTINTAEGIDTTQADVIVADDVKDGLSHLATIPVIYISSDGTQGIRKPFVIDELLQALMDVYEPSVKNDIEVKEDLKAEEIAGKEPLSKLEKLNKEFSEARLSKDKGRILLVVKEIQGSIEEDSNRKWFDTILNHHAELSELQLELALRNIQTFLQRRM